MPTEHENEGTLSVCEEPARFAESQDEQAGEELGQLPGMTTRLRVAGQICEGQVLERSPARRDVRVTVIRGGASVNGYYYSQDALQAIAGLLENAQAYVDHADGAARSVRDVVGFYREAALVAPDEATPGGRVEATLHILESADWLWSMIREACAMRNPGLIGLSIDIYGTWQPRPANGLSPGASASPVRSCKWKQHFAAFGRNLCRFLAPCSPNSLSLNCPFGRKPCRNSQSRTNTLPPFSVARGVGRKHNLDFCARVQCK